MEKFIRQSISLKKPLDHSRTKTSLEEIINYARAYKAGSFAVNRKSINMVQSSHQQKRSLLTKNCKKVSFEVKDKVAANKEVLMLVDNSDAIGRIQGIAILNDIKISYLCDSGADESLLSEQGFKKLAASGARLNPYNGPNFRSASGCLEIIGTVNVPSCVIDPNTPLHNFEFKVAKLNCRRDCLLGMDIIQKTPILYQKFKDIKNTINSLSSKNHNWATENDDGASVFMAENSEDLNPEDKVFEAEIVKNLEMVAAKNFNELDPNSKFTHHIQLIDPNIKPIRQKTRPVPFTP